MRVDTTMQVPLYTGQALTSQVPDGREAEHATEPTIAQAPRDVEEKDELQNKAVRERIDKAIKALNSMVFDRRLQFEKHEATDRILVRVIDTNTDEVIREIPPKRILDMIGQMMQGLLVDERI